MGDHGQAQQPRRLADFIRERREQIISDWEARIRRLKPVERLERPVLLDHIPTFLDDLCEYISEVRAGLDSAPSRQTPAAHALDRLELGYNIREIVAEYSTLRECLLELASRAVAGAIVGGDASAARGH